MNSKDEQRARRKVNTKKFKLNKVEKEVLHYHFIDLLTNEEIADKRNTSVRAVEQAIQRLKKKGFWNDKIKTFAKQGGYKIPQESDNYRLHAEQFYIRILDKTDNFINRISKEKTGVIYKDNNVIVYNSKSVQIISKKDFNGKDGMDAQTKSMEYWIKFIHSVEQQLKVVLVKEGYQNIIYTKRGEYADVDNKLIKDIHSKNQRLIVRGTDDGVVWFEGDKSWNRDEGEYKHPVHSLDDSMVAEETFKDLEENFTGIPDAMNDIRDNFKPDEPFLPTEVMFMIASLSKNINLLSKSQDNLQKYIIEIGVSQKNTTELFNNLIKTLTPQQKEYIKDSDHEYGQYFN